MTNLITALSTYLDKPVIFADQAAPKPAYPYLAIKITSQFIPESGHPVIVSEDMPELEQEPEPAELEDIKQTATSSPTMVLSVTEYTDDLATAGQLAQQAHDWFGFVGYHELKGQGFVAVEVMAVTNRDTLIVDDYEYRRGFDVRLRFIHSVERFIEAIETVAGKIIEQDFEIGE